VDIKLIKMIDIKELRIGNYAKHNDAWSYRGFVSEGFLFQWEDRDWYALGECTLFIENVEPIELTEDILIKCGFVKTYEEHHFYSVKFSDYEQVNANIQGGVVYIHDREIKYVHQLQNIVYALSGNELNITL
jgi:hypothetical protein